MPMSTVSVQPGRLPLGVRHFADEPLESFIDRLAARYRTSREPICRVLGIISPDGRARLPAGYTVTLSDKTVQQAATATGLAPAAIRQMLLCGLEVLTQRDDDGRQRDARALGLWEWVHIHGSNVCPDCLATRDGALRMRWKLPWSF